MREKKDMIMNKWEGYTGNPRGMCERKNVEKGKRKDQVKMKKKTSHE